MILTRSFPPEAFAEALESWSWLPISDKQPVLATVFGDIFLYDADGYWFLDAAGGKLEKLASTKDELKSILSSAEGQDRYLLAGVAEAAEAKGLRLQPSEVFDFTKPPVLGPVRGRQSLAEGLCGSYQHCRSDPRTGAQPSTWHEDLEH